MAILGLTPADLTGPPAPDFPLLGGLPRARLAPGWDTLEDLSQTPVIAGLNPALPSMVVALEGSRILWMNQAARELVHTPEEANTAMEAEKCLALFIGAL